MGQPPTEKDNITLTQSCLRELRNVVDLCRQQCSPNFSTPEYTSSADVLHEQLQRFAADLEVLPGSLRLDLVWDCIKRSRGVLNDCAQAAIPFNRIGAECQHIGVGVYGSYGRLEARPSSDVEFAVYYRGEVNSLQRKDLALTLWHRMIKYMVFQRKLNVEGSNLVPKRESLIDPLELGSDLPNRYLPIIDIDALLSESKQRSPAVRARYYQILTECRSVFNPSFLTWLKTELLGGHEKEVRLFKDYIRGS